MAHLCWWLVKIVREQQAEIRQLKARLAQAKAQLGTGEPEAR